MSHKITNRRYSTEPSINAQTLKLAMESNFNKKLSKIESKFQRKIPHLQRYAKKGKETHKMLSFRSDIIFKNEVLKHLRNVNVQNEYGLRLWMTVLNREAGQDKRKYMLIVSWA